MNIDQDILLYTNSNNSTPLVNDVETLLIQVSNLVTNDTTGQNSVAMYGRLPHGSFKATSLKKPQYLQLGGQFTIDRLDNFYMMGGGNVNISGNLSMGSALKIIDVGPLSISPATGKVITPVNIDIMSLQQNNKNMQVSQPIPLKPGTVRIIQLLGSGNKLTISSPEPGSQTINFSHDFETLRKTGDTSGISIDIPAILQYIGANPKLFPKITEAGETDEKSLIVLNFPFGPGVISKFLLPSLLEEGDVFTIDSPSIYAFVSGGPQDIDFYVDGKLNDSNQSSLLIYDISFDFKLADKKIINGPVALNNNENIQVGGNSTRIVALFGESNTIKVSMQPSKVNVLSPPVPAKPSAAPSVAPSATPSAKPSATPSVAPSAVPSAVKPASSLIPGAAAKPLISPAPKSSHKGSLVIFIILLLILALVGGFLYYKKTSKNAQRLSFSFC